MIRKPEHQRAISGAFKLGAELSCQAELLERYAEMSKGWDLEEPDPEVRRIAVEMRDQQTAQERRAFYQEMEAELKRDWPEVRQYVNRGLWHLRRRPSR